MPLAARLGALIVSVLTVSAVALAERAGSVPPLVNWSAPATYSPSGSSKIRALTDISSPVPFITTAPCRQYNSLLASPLLQAVNRAVTLTGAPCNIPAGAVAVSVNITVFNISGATGNGVFKVDTVTPPAVAWINYPPSEAQRGNAGVVALNGGGQIIVQVAQGAGQVDFIVDTNGYYASAAANQGNTFKVINSGGNTMPAIWGENDSASSNATAVYGVATASTGDNIGVWGRSFSSSNLAVGVFGNSEATAGQTFGVYGRTVSRGNGAVGTVGEALGSTGLIYGVVGLSSSTSDGAVGTYGQALGSTGASYGVQGVSMSTSGGAAGVYGVEASGAPGGGSPPAGVLGASTFQVGVLGQSRTVGVAGFRLTTAGAIDTAGYLGFGGTAGVYFQNGLAGTGTKSFVEPHPTDATKLIKYVSIEGPEAGVYFRGRGYAHKGLATIEVPENFRMVASEEGLSIQVTPIGDTANVGVLQIDLNRIVVKVTRDLEFFYTVNGVRKAYPTWNPIQENRKEFVPEGPDARLPAYLSANETQRLIDNGTYNADGSVNMKTAERSGWLKAWADREAETQAAVRETRSAASANRR